MEHKFIEVLKDRYLVDNVLPYKKGSFFFRLGSSPLFLGKLEKIGDNSILSGGVKAELNSGMLLRFESGEFFYFSKRDVKRVIRFACKIDEVSVLNREDGSVSDLKLGCMLLSITTKQGTFLEGSVPWLYEFRLSIPGLPGRADSVTLGGIRPLIPLVTSMNGVVNL